MVEPISSDVVDARRAPRVPVRLPVELRHRGATWRAETEDVGPRGCQVATPLVLPAGRDVALSIPCNALGRAVAAAGRVAWARIEPPARLGISFEVAPADRDWFEAFLRDDPSASRAATRALLRLPRGKALYLGQPPVVVVDFSGDELAVLRAVGAGATVDEVAEQLGARIERARGALFSLLARRLVVLQPGPPDAPVRWEAILSEVDARGPLAPPPRPPEAQRLYDEGITLVGKGRLDLAVLRFRAALALVPEDASIAGTLARLERWS